ncbi:general secretion pathway protein GspK [Cognatilysobacter lacus]|uniref:Type II secretion system protein K n=1 Tax=Cognatilysobacter lacus TaxID=1643323 RepID=A0A5D8ZEX0_9GAMM|nr:type II secretion system protein GspK [Lysobacter lacus]TZF91244.1 general secretion pathway protein GspK [Lysobacter lacus]
MSRMRGAALLLVLWLMVLLIALVGAFSMAAQTEGLQGHALVDGVQADQIARAGLEYALTRVGQADPRRQWRPDGRPYRWTFADADVEVRIVDEDGKVDLNHADAPLLTGLLVAVGIERPRAEKLAGAIIDWRDPDPMTQPSGGAEDPDYAAAGLPYGAKDNDFESSAELLQVLGVTPDDYHRIAPYVTVFSGRTLPEPAYAGAPVLTAMGMDGKGIIARREAWDPSRGQPLPGVPGGETLQAFGSGTYSIESRARLRGGRIATLGAVVRTGGSAIPGMAYTPLRWEEGIPSP